MFSNFISSWVGAVLLLFPAAALAWELVPISQEFDASGTGATRTYELVNPSQDYVAVELRTMRRVVDLEGNERLTDAEDDFLVFPPQVILDPGGRQSVRVSYIGESQLESETAYRIVAEQLPIAGLGLPVRESQDKPTGAMQVMLVYKGSLYVRPRNVRPKLEVVSVTGRRGADGKPELELELSNSGTARANAKDFAIRISSEGKKSPWVPLSKISAPPILAGLQRRAVMPWPSDLPFTERPAVETRGR